jgi:hypothetical protein
MTDHMNQRDETHLDDLFAEARQVRPVVSVDLMARIMADAAAVQSERTAPIVVAAPEQGGFFAGLWTALGGWGGAGGLAAATMAGLWIGIAPPSGLESVSTAVFGQSETVSLFASDDILGAEG